MRSTRVALGWRRSSNIGLTPVDTPPATYVPALKFNDNRNSQYIPLVGA